MPNGLAALLFRDLTHHSIHPRCACSISGRILECVNMREANVARDLVRLLKIVLSLSGESHDDISRKIEVRDFVPDGFDHL